MSEEIDSDTKSLHAALFLLADIRRAVGDPTGKLMQDELVAHCGEVYKRSQSTDCHICDDVRKQLKGLQESKLHGDDGLAAATMRGFDAFSENENYWQSKYERLNLSIEKNKRLFADEFAEKVIEQQKKRIHQLETELIEAKYQLRKETK